MARHATDKRASAATPAQLRAVLAVLQIDTETFDRRGQPPDQSIERAELTGLLHGVIGSELRELVVGAPLGQCAQRWSSAAAATQSAVGGSGLSEQAQFDARWLRDQIDALNPRDAQASVPTLLTAAARAVDAATTLLALARDPHGDGSEAAWQAVTNDLATAFHLVNDEHTHTTQPIR